MKHRVSELLSAIESGDPTAPDQLLPLVYDELRRLAARNLARERPGQTLQPTALVHEAYVRLVGGESPAGYRDRGHFFAAAAGAMRRILIEQARRKRTQKRGGGMARAPLEDVAVPEPSDDLLALDEALEKLTALDPRKAKVVELKYFAGLTGDEVAAVLGVSPSAIDRDWAYARAWLQTEMEGR